MLRMTTHYHGFNENDAIQLNSVATYARVCVAQPWTPLYRQTGRVGGLI